MPARALIFGCGGPRLSAAERAFFTEAEPWGFILFGRNIEGPAQVRALTDEMRDLAGSDVPIFIDQEGGRVARLKAPLWRTYPPARRYGELPLKDGLEAARIASHLIAVELQALGINGNCLPVLDVPVVGADNVIGDRAYAASPEQVAALGRAAAEGLMEGGVLPVIKHIPGHGRASVDSHLSLPVINTSAIELMKTDFKPFQALADMPVAMTAHVVYSAIDAEAPATTSRKVIADIIRGVIGFEGLLMSDDLSMQALKGTLSERAGASLRAGCDVVLHCNGKPDEMEAVAAEAHVLAGDALVRATAALDRLCTPHDFDERAALARFQTLMHPFTC